MRDSRQAAGRRRLSNRARRLAMVASLLVVAVGEAGAGGLSLYEVGTADVGLASAGYGARAQDASTVLTNPAGMTRLAGTQVLAAAQLLYGDVDFSRGSGTSPELGRNEGGNPIGWFPGGSFFITQQVSPDLTVGFGTAGNFGLAVKYDTSWLGRYYGQEGTLIGLSLLPSVAYKVNDRLSLGATVNAMFGIMKQQVAINNPGAPGRADGRLELSDREWGWGLNLGLLYEVDPATRLGLTWNSQVKLDFSARPDFSGLSPVLAAALASRGALRANLDLGIHVPQGVMASAFHQVNDQWAVLGSVGWQQWSKFGEVDIGISDTNNPASLTTDLDFKDTWHVALGGQYRISQPWLLNFGVAYDSAFQSGDIQSPLLPANSAWRFGIGVQNEIDRSFNWGLSAEYVYGGTLDLQKNGELPVRLGGRGDVDGAYRNTGVLFMAANLNWKF
ncbi:MAG: Outer membrane protein P1 [Accumulibacter sp.]|uniref:OmpP1/FadL family transporter n=1 Tax=Accumulibacter sp. TaxID=2053492 RepID=UPI00122B4031|nr:outer membrane protein transport protein [Accumulibacter sp.]TLD47438.1 MAG: Outer membrane protein P1 [Accumulibacter sp.]